VFGHSLSFLILPTAVRALTEHSKAPTTKAQLEMCLPPSPILATGSEGGGSGGWGKGMKLGSTVWGGKGQVCVRGGGCSPDP
jgi:hypothetical protein